MFDKINRGEVVEGAIIKEERNNDDICQEKIAKAFVVDTRKQY